MLSFPGHFTSQAHPSVDMFKEIETLNSLLKKTNEGFEQSGISKLTPENFRSAEPATLQECRDFAKTDPFIQLVQEQLHHLPRDSYTYFYALKYVEREVLKNKLSSSNIFSVVKRIGQIVFPEGGGEYRKISTLIFDDRKMPKGRTGKDFKTLDDLFRKTDVFEIWKAQTRTKVWKAEFDKEKVFQLMDADDVKCLERIATIAPPPDQIASRMNELTDAIQSQADCYAVAGRVHQIIVKAHPFLDGNGRTARIMMNIVLKQAGNPPLLIVIDQIYTEGVSGDILARYIRELAAHQPACDPVVSLALRNLFDDTPEGQI